MGQDIIFYYLQWISKILETKSDFLIDSLRVEDPKTIFADDP